MKNKIIKYPFVRIGVFLSLLVVIAIVIALGLFYYIFSIPEPEGLSLAWWPNRFTDNFSEWMEYENGEIHVQKIGLERLEEYGLWVQVIDENGQEIFAYRKPANYPTSYSMSELIDINTKRYENGNSVFISSFENSGKIWNYIVGFPYDIGKSMLYYNGETVGRLSPILRMVILLVFVTIFVSGISYCFWITRHLNKITKGIGTISLRTYKPIKEKGVFSNIYTALNEMDIEIRHSDKVQEDTDKVRREWIANITHDLKTPLSPIKGYAEMLADTSTPDSQTVQEYGTIILKNVNHAEKLMNNLKLTYQLDSGAIPYSPQKVRLIRYLKELVIDIINDTAFSGRDIGFESDLPELTVYIDPGLLRRALQNLIVNALVHNPPKTKVITSVELASENCVNIFIRDNGRGINETEQANLFNRYYRGTNTKERPEGSGLGLAIAKQIITLHGGDITVRSNLGAGTEFIISLPLRATEN